MLKIRVISEQWNLFDNAFFVFCPWRLLIFKEIRNLKYITRTGSYYVFSGKL